MTETTISPSPRRIPAFTAWWIVSLLATLALVVAGVLLLNREPEVVVREVSSSESVEPTDEMLTEVARLNAEADALGDETLAILRLVAAYTCPPGTTPADVTRLDSLKAKARAILTRPSNARLDVPKPGRPQSSQTDAATQIATGTVPATGEGTKPAVRLSPTQLSDLLEKALVFVLTTKDRRPVANGTGFFIAPDLVVTNRHVIEGSDLDAALLTSEALGNVMRALVVAASEASRPGGADFAVLRTDRPVAPAMLVLSGQHSKLMQVTAAGYPGLALTSDEGFLKLVLGDRRSAPDMHQNSGEIRSIKEIGGTQFIVHTADVLAGYSGGPLVDMCGRVVGVNTYIPYTAATSAKVGITSHMMADVNVRHAQAFNVVSLTTV